MGIVENAKEFIYGGLAGAGNLTERAWGSVSGFGHSVAQQGTDLVVGGMHSLQEKSVAELGTRVLLLGTGVATAVVGVRQLRGIREIKNGADRAVKVMKSAFFLGASAIEITLAFMLPAFSKNAQ